MKITLLTVGKIKEKYLRDAIAEYSKRLSKYCKLEIIEVADEKTPDHASEVVEKSIRDKEGERLMRYIRDDDYVITLENWRKDARFRCIFPSVGESWHPGTEPYLLCDRWFDRARGCTFEAFQLCAEFFENDISASADAGDPARTDLPFLPNHDESALSQVKQQQNETLTRYPRNYKVRRLLSVI